MKLNLQWGRTPETLEIVEPDCLARGLVSQ